MKSIAHSFPASKPNLYKPGEKLDSNSGVGSQRCRALTGWQYSQWLSVPYFFKLISGSGSVYSSYVRLLGVTSSRTPWAPGRRPSGPGGRERQWN